MPLPMVPAPMTPTVLISISPRLQNHETDEFSRKAMRGRRRARLRGEDNNASDNRFSRAVSLHLRLHFGKGTWFCFVTESLLTWRHMAHPILPAPHALLILSSLPWAAAPPASTARKPRGNHDHCNRISHRKPIPGRRRRRASISPHRSSILTRASGRS